MKVFSLKCFCRCYSHTLLTFLTCFLQIFTFLRYLVQSHTLSWELSGSTSAPTVEAQKASFYIVSPTKQALRSLTCNYTIIILVCRSEFFHEDGSLQEVHKINEMYATLQEELKVSQLLLHAVTFSSTIKISQEKGMPSFTKELKLSLKDQRVAFAIKSCTSSSQSWRLQFALDQKVHWQILKPTKFSQ